MKMVEEQKETVCSRCGSLLAAGEEKVLQGYVRIPAAVAMAFMHGGLWAMQSLSQPLCSRCRKIVITAAFSVVVVVFAAVLIGIRIWIGAIRSWRAL